MARYAEHTKVPVAQSNVLRNDVGLKGDGVASILRAVRAARLVDDATPPM